MLVEDNKIQTLASIHEEMSQSKKDGDIRLDLIIKIIDRHEELMRISGEHMSHMRKDMNDMKNLLIDNSKKIEIERQVTEAHMKRVEPMIKAYETDLAIKDNDTKRGDKVIRWSILVGSTSVLGGAILWAFDTLKHFK